MTPPKENFEEFRKELRYILTPPAPREAPLHGGVVDWEYKYNKAGLDFLIEKIEEAVRSRFISREKVEETLKKEIGGVVFLDTQLKSIPQQLLDKKEEK